MEDGRWKMEAKALATLHNSELFEGVDEPLLQALISECEPVSWKKGETLDPDLARKHLYIILDGRLKMTQIDPNTGRSVTLFLLNSGDIYDIFTLLDDHEHITFPIALDHIDALRIPLPRAREWLCEHQEFNKQFLPYLGKMLRHLEAFSESMVFDDTMTRLAKLILRHTDPNKRDHHGHFPVRLIHNLSHESLAEMIGSVRAVVSTQIHKLKEEEIVLSKRGHLAIKNLEALLKKSDITEQCIYEKHEKKRQK